MELPIITAAGGLVQNNDGAVLLIFRRGFWDLPKGKLDAGELIPECAVREVREETGLQTITLGPFICMTTHTYFDKWTQQNVKKETHWYAMKASSLVPETLIPQTEEDIEKIEWVPVQQLPQFLVQTYPTIRSVFDAFNGGIPKS
ncbi:MAG: NUDIX hydrolase [Bacteroidetes bacterium]|jgi:8-oxo-dGTP pyrophosphatase MutT (NUDIX family)|nr:NUDIX hydrolase [Bacteroidota bacterium]